MKTEIIRIRIDKNLRWKIKKHLEYTGENNTSKYIRRIIEEDIERTKKHKINML